ncbi:hypothetical protein CKAH01_05730 [Colletotrichum kahawae]|uniref:Uncharacterized protein n=1 Tax=Colletotrichum kahawae TaxID=34407 RepID=A0AAD9YC12_COLKA|nr:hypothetical protein CKAH01_05730 [Colletotrichum kahawae]
MPGSAAASASDSHQFHQVRARGRLPGIKMMNPDHTIPSIITKHGKPSYPAPPLWPATVPDRTYYAYQPPPPPPPPPPVAPIEASRDTDWRDPTRPKRESSANDWGTGDCHLRVAFSLRIASRLPINEVCRGGSIPTLELTYKPCRHCSPPTPAPPRVIDSESGVFLTEFETADNAAVDTPGPWHADCECKCTCRCERRRCQAELAVLFLIPKEIKHQPNEHILCPVPPAKRPKKPPQLTGVTLAEHGLPTMQARADDYGRCGRGRLPDYDSRLAVHQSLLFSFDQSPYLDLKITEPSLQLEWQSGR